MQSQIESKTAQVVELMSHMVEFKTHASCLASQSLGAYQI